MSKQLSLTEQTIGCAILGWHGEHEDQPQIY
jgi:hypothetical protein